MILLYYVYDVHILQSYRVASTSVSTCLKSDKNILITSFSGIDIFSPQFVFLVRVLRLLLTV